MTTEARTDERTPERSARARWLAAGTVLALMLATSGLADAQELEPRAYRTMPVGLNFLLLATSFMTGNVVLDPSAPISDLDVDVAVPALGYLRSFGLLGRSASISAQLPYGFISGSAMVGDELVADSRSGSADLRARLAVNLIGGPALSPAEFAQYRQGRNLGVSLSVMAPTGQYDPTRLINFGNNRWAFKPEIGYSSIRGRWIFDFAVGAWFFTTNDDFLGAKRTQDPIGSFQAHLSYNFPNRIWVAFDANYFTGGRTTLNGVESDDLQRNSRLGFTLSLPLGGPHSLKLAAHTGAYTSAGADFDAGTIAYQYRW